MPGERSVCYDAVITPGSAGCTRRWAKWGKVGTIATTFTSALHPLDNPSFSVCAGIDSREMSSMFSLSSGSGVTSPSARASHYNQHQPGPSSASASSAAGYSLSSTPGSVGPSAASSGFSSVLPKVNPASRIVSGTSSLQQQLFGGGAANTAGQGPASILDRPLNRAKGAEVSLGAFAFLFSEIVAYSQSRVDSVTDLERRSVHFACVSRPEREEPECAEMEQIIDTGV